MTAAVKGIPTTRSHRGRFIEEPQSCASSLADPATFTRPWFGWGDALFAELLLDLTGRSAAALHPRLSTTAPPSR